MSVELELMQLQNLAKRNKKVRDELFATRTEKDPYKAFCDKAAELGFNIPLYELADMGDAFCDTMMRSVNGGGRDSFEIWADFYGMFFDALT